MLSTNVWSANCLLYLACEIALIWLILQINITRNNLKIGIPLLFAAALLFFLYGAFKFFIQNDQVDRDEGQKYMIGAVIAFVVMVSVFGIVNLIAGGLGFSDDEEIENIPNVPTSNR